MFCNKSTVELINHMGDDLTVVNAARVSMHKTSFSEEYEEVEYPNKMWLGEIPKLSNADKSLISYLAKHNHWTPFAHCQLQFRVKMPVFVARQLIKHSAGIVVNEVSRRYVSDDPEFYLPEHWRKSAENVKQGSSSEIIQGTPDVDVDNSYISSIGVALEMYRNMMKIGVCPEQARMVLPVSHMTEWYWTGSLYAFARVCKLRLDSHSQKETADVAEEIYKNASLLFPVSWKALMNEKTN